MAVLETQHYPGDFTQSWNHKVLYLGVSEREGKKLKINHHI
jgi:hypothetical protein